MLRSLIQLPLSKSFDSSEAIMLYLVGLGLADETDITVKGLEVVKKAERVYLEAYTSILLVDKEKLVSVFSHADHSSIALVSCNGLVLTKT